jgi:hypothetical protein
MRTLGVAFLLTLAGVLSLVSNVGLWVDRTVYDTDTFVSTTDNVLDDEDVQQVIAQRFSDQLFVSADVESRLQTELPDGLKFLALPLANAVREFLQNATLRFLERQPFEDVRTAALERTHAQLIDVIEGRSDAVSTEGGELVIDLRPVLEQVAQDVTNRDVELPQEGGGTEAEIPEDVLNRLPPRVRERLERTGDDGLLTRLQLPEDAGRLVIQDASIAWAYNIARYGNDIVYAIVVVTLACYAGAILIARDRRSTIRTAGFILAASGIVSLAIVLPLTQVARNFAEHDDAATSVVDILTAGYKQQSLVMIGAGFGIAAVAALFGGSPVAVAVRSSFRPRADAPSLAELARERVGMLRVAGLVAAAVALVVWPDPTARVYVTTLVLLGLYLGALFVLASDAPFAANLRAQVERYFSQSGQGAGANGGPLASWIAAHAAWLRVAGLLAAVVLLIAWPSPSLGTIMMVVALALIYLALLDFVANRTESGVDRS